MLHETLIWFKHAAFLYMGSVKIYFDPWEIDDAYGKADIILVTHAHYDHFSPETITALSTDKTIVISPPDVGNKILGIRANVFIKPKQTIKIDTLTIQGVHAYNIDKAFHPKENAWLGYIVSIDGKRIYHAGDTDHVEEMKDIKADIALLPIGGTYTMNVKEAVEAAKDIGPKLAIPMHYGYVVGREQDGKDFAGALGEKAEVLIPKIPFKR